MDWAAGWLRRIVPRGSALHARLEVLRHKLPTARARSRVEQVIHAFADAYPDAYFIQVGSNDGTNQDPLRRAILTHRWRGILVEPVPHIFERLRRNYRLRDGLAFENAAIADADGTRNFYHLRPAEPGASLPPWYELLGSFSRDVILSHRGAIPDIDQRVIAAPVPCLTFETLCRRHGVARLDLLHVDAEGYDDVILAQVDLARWRPRLVLYEHCHLAPASAAALRERLRAHGYEMLEENLDTLCLRVAEPGTGDAALLRAWRGLVDLGGAPR